MTSPTPLAAAKPTHGPARTIIAVAGVAVLLNGGLALFGNDSLGVGSQVLPMLAPPGWLVGGVWMVLFALLGLARWRLVRLGSEAGRQGARWTIAFVHPNLARLAAAVNPEFMGNTSKCSLVT